MQIEVTEEQANALIQLLDAATKAGGLQLAGNALFFTNLLQEAAKKAAPGAAETPKAD